MKGRNPLVIIFFLVALAFVAGIIFFSGGNDEITVTGRGEQNAKNDVKNSNSSSPDADTLPTEFKKLIGDIQYLKNRVESLESVKDSVGVLNSNNKIKDGSSLALKNGMESLLTPAEKEPSVTTLPNEIISPPSTDSSNNSTQAILDSLVPPIIPTGKKKTQEQDFSEPDQVVWIKPLDSGYSKKKNNSRLTSNYSPGEVNQDQPGLLDEVGSKAKNTLGLESGKDPRFTIPHGSIIADSMAVTAFIGKIPVKGQLQDPWKFKLSTGQNIIMPNDHELQGLEKTIIEGTAIGDLNLRCVTGRIETMTFIFTDGQIMTHKATKPKDGMGYISDSHANPCIPGELITNAPQIISQMSLLGIGEGFSKSYADAETQTRNNLDGTTNQVVIGDHFANAGFNGISSGFSEVKKWFSDRIGQYFDVIYVPGGQHVDIHISEEIKIDYDPMGRKVKYDTHSDATHGYMD
ncbi:TIGR03752 family integrating conjugative element protein [Hydrogenovibrio sp. SC-1]|uniref:TIGR03752 family integrating conjugative element protein n=1 Tax=Hydrogenovibrio sp. SC-1 TaxID=2065820 RepID=UPI000C7B6B8B|nr:TIGR03752 family integrating conjugative element protein [Hydrogenovibrio sp. SC-1]PLA73963.1 TIGR03752 family integrating conjugative element protein [Hydrogenovibrio sp. SC-1]